MPNLKDSAIHRPVLQASWLRNDSDGNFWVQENKQGPRPQLLFLGIEGENKKSVQEISCSSNRVFFS